MNILEEAAEIVYGDREQTYGDPSINFRRAAAIWSVILDHPVTEEQVCLCQIGLKLARLVNKPDHRDSLVDIPGYAALVERIQAYKGTNNGKGLLQRIDLEAATRAFESSPTVRHVWSGQEVPKPAHAGYR